MPRPFSGLTSIKSRAHVREHFQNNSQTCIIKFLEDIETALSVNNYLLDPHDG